MRMRYGRLFTGFIPLLLILSISQPTEVRAQKDVVVGLYQEALKMCDTDPVGGLPIALRAYELCQKLDDAERALANTARLVAKLYGARSMHDSAAAYFRISLSMAEAIQDTTLMTRVSGDLGKLFAATGQLDSNSYYSRRSIALAEVSGLKDYIADGHRSLGIICERRGAFDEALAHHTKSAALYEELGDETWVAYSCVNLGGISYNLGEYRAASGFLERGLSLFRKLGQNTGIAWCLQFLAEISKMRGDFPATRAYLADGLKAAETAQDLERVAAFLGDLGEVFGNMGEYDSARSYLQRAYAISLSINDPQPAFFALSNLGKICLRQGDITAAREYFSEVERIAAERADPAWEGEAQWNYARLYEAMDSTAKTIEYAWKAVHLIERLEIKKSVAGIMNLLGRTYEKTGRLDESLDSYLRSLELAREIGSPYDIATTELQIGHLYFKMENFTNAIELYERSYSAFRKFEDQYIENQKVLVDLEYRLGYAYNENGNDRDALRYYRHCLTRGRATQEHEHVALCLLEIGNIYQAMDSLTRCMQYYDEGMAYARKYDVSDVVQTSHRTKLADMHFRLGNDREAKDLFEETLEDPSVAANPDHLVLTLKRLHRLYARLHAYDRAYEVHRALMRIKDSIATVKSDLHMEEVIARYEAHEKQRRIEELERQRKLQALELAAKTREAAFHQLQADRNRKAMLLTRKEKEIQHLELERANALLSKKELDEKLRSQEIASLQRQGFLQADLLDREKSVRNLLIIGAALILIIATLLFKRFRDKRREALIRAESAEYKAQVLEVETVRLHAESERKEREAQETFSRKLMLSQEEERANLAYELHDTLCQDLIVAKNLLALALDEKNGGEQIRDGMAAISSSLESVRRMSRDLRPFQIDEYGISSAIKSMLKRLDENTQLHIESDIHAIDGIFQKEQEITIFRICQEGMNNILKHAGASEATVSLHRMDGMVSLSIQDNGAGFDAAAVGEGGFGLTGIRQRVRMLGGELSVSSAPGKGTRLGITFPVPDTLESAGKIERESVSYAG